MRRVYFIKPVGMNGPVKIGCSFRPGTRRDELETWSPFALEIIAQIEGDFQIEKRFHALFFDQHERREWFTWTPSLQAIVDNINAGTFDVATLPAPRNLPLNKGAPKGRKWTEAEKHRCRLRNAMRRAEKLSGLVCDFPHTDPRVDAFIADPFANGVTREVREQGSAVRVAQWRQEEADRCLRSAGLNPEEIDLRSITA